MTAAAAVNEALPPDSDPEPPDPSSLPPLSLYFHFLHRPSTFISLTISTSSTTVPFSPPPPPASSSARRFDWISPNLVFPQTPLTTSFIIHPSNQILVGTGVACGCKATGDLFTDLQPGRRFITWLMCLMSMRCWAWPNPNIQAVSLAHLEESPVSVHQLQISARRSNISFERKSKFFWFFKNLETLIKWLRSESLHSNAIILITLASHVESRYVLERISRIKFVLLEWLSVHRNYARLIKLCDHSFPFVVRLIRPLPFLLKGDWLPVSKPRKNSTVWVRVILSSLQLERSKRAIYVVLKKVDDMCIPLQISILKCPVDWELLVEISVVGCRMVKASDKVYGFSSSRSDSNFGYLSIMEDITNKLCMSFDFILLLMSLNSCLCSFMVVVTSCSSDVDLNNVPLWNVTG